MKAAQRGGEARELGRFKKPFKVFQIMPLHEASVCGPSTLKFKDLGGDIPGIRIALYDRASNAKGAVSAGAAIAENCTKRKLAPEVRAWDFFVHRALSNRSRSCRASQPEQ